MKLQQCEKCASIFDWKQIYKSICFNYRPINCNECGSQHKIHFLSRFIVVMVSLVPTYSFLIISPQYLKVNFWIGLFIIIGWVSLSSLIIPFLVRYTTSEEKT